ncbi:MAG: endonuclease III [Flavobacteriales bacterium]|nr:endonuclease III [Flavobacteriales bacterium]
MTEKQKARFIMKTLEKLYPNPAIPLHFNSDYTFLIAVLLSAQSTDARVNKTTPSLFALADTPEKMMSLPTDKIIEAIRPVGLSPTKGRHIKELSEILVEKYEGKVPSTFEKLESLPGVGHKTASVIMSQAFGVPAFPVDTHIHRLMTRWGLTSGKNVVQTEKDAKRIFPREKWNDLHLQIIYYGREYSPARGLDLSKDVITATIMGLVGSNTVMN